jgi:hypothetical protein
MRPTQVKQPFHRDGLSAWRAATVWTIRAAFLISPPPWLRCQGERSCSTARWRSSIASYAHAPAEVEGAIRITKTSKDSDAEPWTYGVSFTPYSGALGPWLFARLWGTKVSLTC